MDYGKVLSRAWQITWRWKILWILGFLTSLSSALSGGTSSYRFDKTDVAHWNPDLASWPHAIAWIVAIGCLALLVGVALWVLSTMAAGGLIDGVRQIEEEGSTTLRSAWRTGVRRFWTLLGISLLLGLPLVVLAVAMGLSLGLGIYGMTNTGVDSTAGTMTASILSVMCGSLLCCGLIPVGIILSLVTTYAQRAAILEDLRWIEAIKRGWRVLRDHLGPTLLVGLLVFLLTAAVGLALSLVAFPIILALVSLFRFGGATAWAIALAVCAGVLGFVVGGFVNAILTTFTSAAWTLAYRRLTATPPAAVEPLPEP